MPTVIDIRLSCQHECDSRENRENWKNFSEDGGVSKSEKLNRNVANIVRNYGK